MPQTLIRYALDPSGISPDNLVENEPHTLAAKRFRAVAPQYGAFYSTGLILVDAATNRTLVRGLDYVIGELYQSLTLKYGKEICGIIIVINPNVSSNIKVTYQVLGGDFMYAPDTLVDLLNRKQDDVLSNSYFDVANRPSSVVPSPHIHDLGDGTGFEFVVFAMERIRNAIVWADSNAIDSINKQLSDFLANLTSYINNRVDTEILTAIIAYKKQFTKALAGLSKVENLPMAKAQDGFDAAQQEFVYNPKTNAYITTQALATFKEAIYSQMVSSKLTNLGRSYGVIAVPLKTMLTSLPNGARVLIDSYIASTTATVQFDKDVYPNTTDSFKDRWSMVKISNNEKDRGGIVMAHNMSNGDMYIGLLRVATSGAITITWKKTLTSSDSEALVKMLTDHLNDPGNAHATNKNQVGLGNVENLPIATKEDIVTRKPKRVYVTYDGLLLFMKAFMTGVKTVSDITADDTTPSAVAQYQMIFAPCGPCGVNISNYSNVPTAAPPASTPIPRDRLMSEYCTLFKRMGRYSDGFGGTYEKLIQDNSPLCGYKGTTSAPRGTKLSEYCEGFNRMGKYADGAGGFFTQEIKHNSTDCGYVAAYTPTYDIRDVLGSLVGYGYSFTDTADPEATVTLRDSAGTPLCLIYPSSDASHNVQILDIDGNLIGYAVQSATSVAAPG